MARPSTIPDMTQPLDICVRGGGIVGRTLALLLARAHLRVGLVQHAAPAPSEAPTPDVRAYALNAKSKALLESLRCWPDAQHATEVLAMQVKGDDGGELNFNAADLQVPGLTWIVDVPVLEAQLGDAVRFQPLITVLEAPQPATLTVICEGKASRTRAEFGIDFQVTPYPQTAIAARVHCESAHGQMARQWFTQGEILAFLPLDGPQGKTVALVWSVPHAQMAQTEQWIGVHDGKAWALAGDAAHNVHPLAGQGLNLGLADVAALAQTLHEREYWRRVDDEKLLRRYERSRKADVWVMGAAMDGLQQLFSQTASPWQSLRNWGMNGFERSGPFKQWVARQAMGFKQ